MSPRSATITQADIARAIRAAKQTGAAEDRKPAFGPLGDSLDDLGTAV